MATHHLLLPSRAAAVGGGQSGGTALGVPGHVSFLAGAADGDGEDGVGVAVTAAAIVRTSAIPRRPHKDGAQSVPPLQ